MAKFLTDEQVETEIAQLLKDDDVKLCEKYTRIQYRRRQYLYGLRNMKKRGAELRKSGFNEDKLESMVSDEEDMA